MMLPCFVRVTQRLEGPALHDIPEAVRESIRSLHLQDQVRPSQTVAITAGSRGVANIDRITRAVVDDLKALGLTPFIVPTMGSHGEATAQGQKRILEHYGITESAMGCPIKSSMSVVEIGKVKGTTVFCDKHAWEADHIVVVGRIKAHTDFDHEVESGLFKMMAIGLGKFDGAQRYHAYAYRLGLEYVIRSVGRQVLQSGRILGGLAILEDAWHNTGKLDAVPVEVMEQREEENQALVKSWMGKVPMDADILIMDEIGKNISGAGMLLAWSRGEKEIRLPQVGEQYRVELPLPAHPVFGERALQFRTEVVRVFKQADGLGMAGLQSTQGRFKFVRPASWQQSVGSTLVN